MSAEEAGEPPAEDPPAEDPPAEEPAAEEPAAEEPAAADPPAEGDAEKPAEETPAAEGEAPAEGEGPPAEGDAPAEGEAPAEGGGKSEIAERIEKDPLELEILETELPEDVTFENIPKINDSRGVWRLGMRKIEETFAEHIANMHLDFEDKAIQYEKIEEKLQTNH